MIELCSKLGIQDVDGNIVASADQHISVSDARHIATHQGVDVGSEDDPEGFHWPYAPTLREVERAIWIQIATPKPYRAAYISADGDSTSGGFRLTTEEQAGLDDEALMAAAMPALAEYNAASRAVGLPEADESDIEIVEWRD